MAIRPCSGLRSIVGEEGGQTQRRIAKIELDLALTLKIFSARSMTKANERASGQKEESTYFSLQ